MAVRKQADRHYRSPQVPVGYRLDRSDYDPFEAAFKAAGLTRRQAVIAAIRDWTRKHATETAETKGETQ